MYRVMGAKIFYSIAFTCLLLSLLFPLHSHAALLKNLQGHPKGDQVKGIKYVKKYLQTFGYLSYDNKSSSSSANYDDDSFDAELKSAIKKFQINFNLEPTGTLDSETISTMSRPRCGVPDNGMNNSQFHSHYAFFEGNPKWPSTKAIITYGFPSGDRKDIIDPVRRAFIEWSKYTSFMYEQTDYDTADIKISFQRRDHGDGNPFDGPGNVLAHAFSPPDGRLHFDADETWADGAVAGAADMLTVALHEIGHTLGLAHSSLEEAVMYAIVPLGSRKPLNSDDIQGIQALYNYSPP
ncbi:hypothetical protein ACOSQ2_011815 [Xanthoceras sorbifolium]